MKKHLLYIIILIWCSSIQAQNKVPWKKIDQGSLSFFDNNTNKSSSNKKSLFRFDQEMLMQSLVAINSRTAKRSSVEISIPNIAGVMEKFLVWESSNFEPKLQAKYPEIRGYAGVGLSDPKASINFSLSPKGIQTMVLRADSGSEFIEASPEDSSLYVLFSSKMVNNRELPFVCSTEDKILNKELTNINSKISANNRVFKTLRLALSCTGEYAAYHGGTEANALAAMNATMTRVNGIFNKDLAVKLEIIANNSIIIYTDATTDPYSDAAAGTAGDWTQEVQDVLTADIGDGNYDIGHLFGASGGGGNAGCIGCVCDAGKGSAYTSPADEKPEGDTFDIDFVAHEMGHQLGANHTFSWDASEITGFNVEPGSGSTIMGYAGITTDYDVQSNSDDYFAYASIKQIQENLSTKNCGSSVNLIKSLPVINAGSNYVIPKGTAFVLKAIGADVNSAEVSYTWEQNDSAINSTAANSLAVPAKTDGPLFRSLYPGSSPNRYMPDYSNVLANKLTSKWESVATVARTLHFVLTGRDNARLGTAQTNSDEMIVNVSGTAGPFAVTSQKTEDLSWFRGSNQTITWSVNGSDVMSGSTNVNIKLSTDGGLTFATVLVANTPNDGSETVVVPNITAENCRILIEPTANIFYAVNSKAFAIGYEVASSCASYSFTAPFPIPEQLAYTTSTIFVPTTTASMSHVNFNVSFTHAYLADVEMEIISPQGTTVKLFDKSCGDNNSTLNLIYDDSGVDLACGITTLQTVTPFQALAAFNGENPSGTWVFRIRDAYPNDTGTLNSASLTLCTQTYTLSVADVNMSDLVIYSNPNKGIFNVQFTSDSINEVKVVVYDLLGRKLFEKQYEKKSNFNESVQLKNIQSGIYFLTVIDGDRKKVKKIVIE
ncbi:zinc-dependent metalloprotease [Flavobacterium sp. W22_SRS_FP1]|uniref:zinc-dependent metalloprotease n=1 Tax=Flavobacterium sp. W22_SRS_FP1 TaxID=3240276 RepID=UPI003F911A86